MELNGGSVAVITGAASGIGAALARAFAAAGCAVVLLMPRGILGLLQLKYRLPRTI